MNNGELTSKQGRFCTEYLVDFNATQAVIRAGYCPSSRVAAEQGHENLRKPKIQKRIRKLVAERNTRTLVAADRVMSELAGIAFNKQNFTTKDRLRALDMLAKHTQAFRRQSYDVPEFLTVDERLIVLMDSVPDEHRRFFGILVLLDPEDGQAVCKAYDEREEKQRQAAEESKARTGRAFIPYELGAPIPHLEFLEKVLSVERIKQSVQKTLDKLFSGQEKQPTPEYASHINGLIAKEIAAPEEVRT